MRFFRKGLKNEFETAMVNEPSVFEPLKFYCIYRRRTRLKRKDAIRLRLLSIQKRNFLHTKARLYFPTNARLFDL